MLFDSFNEINNWLKHDFKEDATQLKISMQKLASELNTPLESCPIPVPEYRPELTPPVINEVLKFKPFVEFWNKQWEQIRQQPTPNLGERRKYFIRVPYRGFTLVLEGTPDVYGFSQISLRVKIALCREFFCNIQAKVKFFQLMPSESVTHRIDTDNTIWKWVVPSKIADNWRAGPQTIYNIKANLPTLDEIYFTACSERKTGEDFVNEWKIRDILLKQIAMSLTVGHLDVFNYSDDWFMTISAHFNTKEPNQLSELIRLFELTVDFFLERNIFTPGG